MPNIFDTKSIQSTTYTTSDRQMNSMEKLSENALYGNYHDDAETIDRYGVYDDSDMPMSVEEKSLVRKIDFFLMPLVCIIIFLQVQFGDS